MLNRVFFCLLTWLFVNNMQAVKFEKAKQLKIDADEVVASNKQNKISFYKNIFVSYGDIYAKAKLLTAYFYDLNYKQSNLKKAVKSLELSNNVQFFKESSYLKSDHAKYKLPERHVVFKGNVKLVYNNSSIKADTAIYDLNENKIHLKANNNKTLQGLIDVKRKNK